MQAAHRLLRRQRHFIRDNGRWQRQQERRSCTLCKSGVPFHGVKTGDARPEAGWHHMPNGTLEPCNTWYWRYDRSPPIRCPNCYEECRGGHYVPPSLGEAGFFICKRLS